MMPVKFFVWTAPDLSKFTNEEIIYLSEQLALIGKEECAERFRHALLTKGGSSLIPEPLPDTLGENWVIGGYIAAGVMLAILLPFLIWFKWILLVILAVLILLGSLELAVWTYARWVSRMLKIHDGIEKIRTGQKA